MYENILVVTYTPDKQGRGGSKTGFHSFTDPPWLDVRELYNLGIVQGRWRKDSMSVSPTDPAVNGSYPTSLAPDNTYDCNSSNGTLAIHGYVFYNASDVANPSASPELEVLSHELGISGASFIWSHRNTIGNIATMSGPDDPIPAEFLNIGKRCFYTTAGKAEGRVRYRTGPTASDVTDYPIGVPAPTTALATTINSTTGASGRRIPAFGVESRATLTSPTDNLVGVSGTAVTIDGKLNGTASLNITAGTAISILGSTSSRAVSVSNGGYIVSFASAGDLTTALGAQRVEGLLFTINGMSCIIAEQGNSAVVQMCATNEIALAEPYLGPDITSSIGWSITGSECALSGGLTAWTCANPGFGYHPTALVKTTLLFFPVFIVGALASDGTRSFPYGWDSSEGPEWAYSFYDPVTGHISNIGPTYKAGSLSGNTWASATFDTASGLLAVPDSNHDDRFTHLVLFRTIASGNGSVLFPVGSLQPYFTVPTSAYGTTRHNPRWYGMPNSIQPNMQAVGSSAGWEDAYKDSQLLESGAFIAPQTTNDPPMLVDNGLSTTLYPKFWEFWDGRLWMIATQDPRALHYSCDAVQCQLGRPEESFPLTNRLPLPAADGFARGLELVGNMLVVTTDRYAYYIAGNNETNYRLMRLSTDMYGVGEYQMDEYAGETENTAAVIAFIGRDKRVYLCQPGSEPVWISEAIQDQLDANINSKTDYQNSRLHTTNIGGRKRIVVKTPLASGQTYQLFIYNLSTSTWSFNKAEQDSSGTSSGTEVIPTAFCTVYGGDGPPIDEIYGYAGDARSWLHNYDAVTYTKSVTNAYISLFPSTLDGKKSRKKLQFVKIFTAYSGGSGFLATIYPDESTVPVLIPFQTQEDDALSIYGGITGTYNAVDSPYAKELVAFAGDATTTIGPPLIAYRFSIKITLPTDINPVDIYAIQVGYTLDAEQNEVDP